MSELLKKLGFESTPLQRTGSGLLTVEVRVENSALLRFLCDTGAVATSIESAVANSKPTLSERTKSLQVGSVSTPWQILLEDLEADGIDGVLGCDWLQEHEAIIDMAKRRLFFKANSKANKS